MAETNDRTCTQCHSQVKDFIQEQFLADLAPESASITSFAYEHPEFRSQASDPTKLKFNHQLHLSPGIRNADERRAAWTLADVAPDARAKYRRAKTADALSDQADETTVVELECRDCHVSVADKAAGLGARADASPIELKNLPRNQSPLETGAYMLPVKFADHCQGCHPLAIDRPRRTAWRRARERSSTWSARRGLASDAGGPLLGEADRRDAGTENIPVANSTHFRDNPPADSAASAEASVEQRVRQAETHFAGRGVQEMPRTWRLRPSPDGPDLCGAGQHACRLAAKVAFQSSGASVGQGLPGMSRRQVLDQNQRRADQGNREMP